MGHRSIPSLAAALVPAAALSIALPAGADPLRVSVSGVFTPETPTLPFSAPGASWSMSFVVDAQPVPIGVGDLTEPGFFVTVPFSDFKLLIDGVEAAPALQVTFYSGPNDGGMDVLFSPVDPGVSNYQSIGTYGAAYYSGGELAPVIEPGSYPTFRAGQTGLNVNDFGTIHWQPAAVVTISAVPEPAAWALMAAGAALLLGRRRNGTPP